MSMSNFRAEDMPGHPERPAKSEDNSKSKASSKEKPAPAPKSKNKVASVPEQTSTETFGVGPAASQKNVGPDVDTSKNHTGSTVDADGVVRTGKKVVLDPEKDGLKVRDDEPVAEEDKAEGEEKIEKELGK